MALRANATTTFEVDKVIQPIYTGGDVDIDRKGQILVTCLGEDAVLTDVNNGQTLARAEGVSIWRIDRVNRNQLITSMCAGWRGVDNSTECVFHCHLQHTAHI